MNKHPIVRNYINGEWANSAAVEHLDVINPATAEILGIVPLSPANEVELAAQAAVTAFPLWRRVPPLERIQYLFKLKRSLEEHFEEISRLVTLECGKILDESRGEIQRAIENIEVACGIPLLMQGYNSEDIAPGIDELMIRQPIGVGAVISPFNFPGMIPFWFMPYAIACGNTYIIKPSEKVPLTMQLIFELVDEIGFPKGVLNLVNGARETVDSILDHPSIRAISFVGSTPVAKHVYSRATANGKRAQCQGGAKNPIVIMPDADIEMTTRIAADSAFGCAGQRCLAASLAITVAEAGSSFGDSICEAAASRVVGFGLDDGVQMGPVITHQSKNRIEQLITQAEQTSVKIPVDGRKAIIPGYENGSFVKPTILMDLPIHNDVAKTEIFGPVLGLIQVNSLDDAITLINQGTYGNMACLFTTDGSAARKFRYETNVGNVGINVGIAAPMAQFPFSGWKESFFGDLHGQGLDAVEFFTQKKVVVERWPKVWSRKF